VIVFNFPHTGMQRVHENRSMLAGFFRAAHKVLPMRGTVHVTIKDVSLCIVVHIQCAALKSCTSETHTLCARGHHTQAGTFQSLRTTRALCCCVAWPLARGPSLAISTSRLTLKRKNLRVPAPPLLCLRRNQLFGGICKGHHKMHDLTACP
jgi:hypothetical protein